MYYPVPCTQEQLLPARWVNRPPQRKNLADHIKRLRNKYGVETGRECRNRMVWIGIWPSRN